MGYLGNLYKIFRGTTAGDKTGTPARTAAEGINNNMDALDNALEAINDAAEKKNNKSPNLSSPNNINYPTTQAAADGDAAAEAAAKTYADGLMGAYQPTSEKGQASGYAPLDTNAKVPAVNLPGFVDEIVEGSYIDSTTFNDSLGNPVTPGAAKIYLDTTTLKQYRWGGSVYGEIQASPGTTDDVLEGSGNLYFTGARVLNTLLAGLNTGVNAAVSAADTVLAAFGKLQAQINSLITDLGTKLDKGTYTGSATDLETLANSKETPLGAQAKADTAESNAKAYADAINGSAGPATRLESFNTGYIDGLNYQPSASWINEGTPVNDTRALSLAAADPAQDRFDLFIVDLSTNQVAIITGTPAANPVAPGYDPATQLAGPLVRITAGATQPDGVLTTDIYKENAEWTVTGGDPASTADVFAGTYALAATLASNAAVKFTAPVALDMANAAQLSYRIKNNAGGGHSLLIQGERSNGRQASFYLDAPALAGYNPNNTTDWQFISLGIPSSNLVNITEIQLISQFSGLDIILDEVKITGGDAAPVSGNYATVDYVNTKDAETLQAAKDYADSLGGGGGTTAPIEKTGLAIDFTERANWNNTSPATSGNITIDTTGAVKDAVQAVFFNGATEPTITGGEMYLKTGRFSADKNLIFWFTPFGGDKYILNIQADVRIPLATPEGQSFATSTSSNHITWNPVSGASAYQLLASTTNDINTATEIYNGANTEFNHTALTQDVAQYYWWRAINPGSLSSAYVTDTATPSSDYVLLHDFFKGTTIDTGKWTVIEGLNGPVNTEVTQDNELIFTDVQNNTTNSPTRLVSLSEFNSDVLVLNFETYESEVSIENFVVDLVNETSGDLVRVQNTSTGIQTQASNAEASGIAFTNRFKSVKNLTTASFYYWDGSAWVLIRSVSCTNTAYKVRFNRYFETTIGEINKVKDVILTNYDYTTLNP